MQNENIQARHEARKDFEQARRRAFRSGIGARLRGKENRLIPFAEIRNALRQQNPLYRGIQQVEISKIIGSVGRYLDFNRKFMPLYDEMAERWIAVQALTAGLGWPPAELYKVGDAYFVRDGNHRIAISNQMDNPTVEAHVWEFPIEISLADSESLDEALIAIGATEFEAKTALSEITPKHTIHFTAPGRYGELLAQIEDIREKIGRIDQTDISFKEAVPIWCELVYLPTVQIIEDSKLVEEFPGRTVADLFVWLSIHRSQLAELYGEYNNLADLAEMLVDRYRPKGISEVARQVRNLLGADKLPHLVEVAEVKDALEKEEEE